MHLQHPDGREMNEVFKIVTCFQIVLVLNYRSIIVHIIAGWGWVGGSQNFCHILWMS